MNGFFKVHHILLGLIGVCAIGIALFQIERYSSFTVDDAYISFRYAENAAAGKGIVFNPGEYVEGYTNFLWVALLGACKKIGMDIEQSAAWLGAICSVVTVVVTLLLSERLSQNSRRGRFPLVFVGLTLISLTLNPTFGIWAVAGLETPLFMMLLGLAVWRHLRETDTNRFSFSPLIFGLLALTRPEGIMFFTLTVLHRAAFLWRDAPHKLRFSKFAGMVGLFALIVIPHILWRWNYYDSLFPNTYYAKVSGGGLRLSGVKYVVDFFVSYGGVAFFLVCCALFAQRRWREYQTTYFLLLFGVNVAYFVYVGGDWMPSFRFFAPLLPIYFLCIQAGMQELYLLLRQSNRLLAVASSLTLIVVFWGNLGYSLYTTPPINTQNDGHFVIGHLLKEQAKPGDILAAIDIGAMAYFSGIRTIDYFGLTDAHIARMPAQDYHFERAYWGRNSIRLKSDIDYIMRHEPTFVEVNTANRPTSAADAIPLDPFSDLMVRHLQFQAHYSPFYHAGGTTLFERNR